MSVEKTIAIIQELAEILDNELFDEMGTASYSVEIQSLVSETIENFLQDLELRADFQTTVNQLGIIRASEILEEMKKNSHEWKNRNKGDILTKTEIG